MCSTVQPTVASTLRQYLREHNRIRHTEFPYPVSSTHIVTERLDLFGSHVPLLLTSSFANRRSSRLKYFREEIAQRMVFDFKKRSQIFRRGSKMRKPSAALTNQGVEDSQDIILKEAFKLFDKDNNGTITHEELRAALKTLGQDVTDDAVDDLMGEVDVDGDHCIGFDEFKEMINSIEEKENIAYNAYIDETFKEFDVDSDELITVRDLRYTLRKLGLDCSFEEVGGIILDSLKEVKAQRHRAARKRMPELSHEAERRESRAHTRTLTRTSSPGVEELEGVVEEGAAESDQDITEEIVSESRELGVELEELRVIAKSWPRPISF